MTEPQPALESYGARFTPGLVRILRPDGSQEGQGLLVGDREIVTCAHVVDNVLGRPPGSTDAPDVPVQVEFPFVARESRFTAEVVAWAPYRADGSGDVAGLRLHEAPPVGAVPSPMTQLDDLFGHPFQVFGFPEGHDTGVWVVGEMRGSDIAGAVHLVGDGRSGLRIGPGFSGSPVWDPRLEAVVGVTSRAVVGMDAPASAYCVSAAEIVRVWPEIERLVRPPCPFRGLRPFQESDAAMLFGRDTAVAELSADIPRNRLTIVTGASGCGKSSLINAGVVVELRRRADLDVRVCRPGLRPSATLRRTLVPAAEPTPEMSPEDLVDGVIAELDRTGRDRLVLVVDQAEEVFGGSAPAAEAAAGLLARLAEARRQDGTPIASVVLVVRGDDLDRLAGAIETDDRAVRHIFPMGAAELRQAVEGPVRKTRSVRLEAGLADRLMRDVRGLANPITLVAFAMTELWDRQRHGVIGLAAYESVGGVAGVLRHHLDRVINEELGEDERAMTRRLLTRLVYTYAEGGHVRRLLPRTELGEQVWPLAQRLAGRRVVTLDVAADGTQVIELAHDALLEEWPQLREWLDEDRDFHEWWSRLRPAMAQWKEGGENGLDLLHGDRLAVATSWAERRPEDLTPEEVEYVRRSERSARLYRLARTVFIVVVVLTVLVGTTGGALLYRRHVQQDTAADVRAAAVNASAASSGGMVDALPSAVAGYRRTTPAAALRVLQQWDERTRYIARIRPVSFYESQSAIYSPDGRYVLAGDSLLDLRDPALRTQPLLPPDSEQRAFTPDGRYVVAGDARHGLGFWDIARRSPVRTLPTRGPGDARIRSVAVDPSGRFAAYARGDHIRIVDAVTGHQIRAFDHPAPTGRAVEDLWFDATGRKLYLLTGRPQVFDRVTGRVAAVPGGAPVFHTRSGREYVTCRDHRDRIGPPWGRARVYDARTEKPATRGFTVAGTCSDTAFALDSRYLYDVAGSGNGTLLNVLDRRDATTVTRLEIPGFATVDAVAQTRAGTRLFVHGDGHYEIRVPRPNGLASGLSIAQDAMVTPDGRRVAAVSDRDGLRVWSWQDGRPLASVPVRKLCAGAKPNLVGDRVAADARGDRVAGLCGPYLTVLNPANGRAVRFRLGAEEGWSEKTQDAFPVTFGFISPHELVTGAHGPRTILDTDGPRRRTRLPVPRFDVTYSGWMPRPGHPQVTAYRTDERGTDLIDVRTGRVVQNIPFAGYPADGHVAHPAAFDATGDRVAISHLTGAGGIGGENRTAAIGAWSIPGHRMLGTVHMPEGAIGPVGFVEHGTTVALAGTISDTSSATNPGTLEDGIVRWRIQPRGIIPWTRRDPDVRTTPVDALRASTGGTHVLYQTYWEGWQAADLDTRDWKRRLCALITEGRLDQRPAATAVSGKPCGP